MTTTSPGDDCRFILPLSALGTATSASFPAVTGCTEHRCDRLSGPRFLSWTVNLLRLNDFHALELGSRGCRQTAATRGPAIDPRSVWSWKVDRQLRFRMYARAAVPPGRAMAVVTPERMATGDDAAETGSAVGRLATSPPTQS